MENFRIDFARPDSQTSIVGIRDRDYMKRPSDDDGDGGSDSKAEEMAQRILKKYSRLFVYGGIALLLLIVIASVVASFSGAHH